MSNAPSQTIIGVPEHWATRSDIATSIASSSGGYLFAGTIMRLGFNKSGGDTSYDC